MPEIHPPKHVEDPLTPLLKHYFKTIQSRLKKTSRTAKLAATVLFILAITGTGIGGKRWLQKRAADKAQRQRLLRRNSGIRGKNGARILVVPYRKSTAKVQIYPTKATTFDAHRRLFLTPPKATGLDDGSALGVPPPQTKPGLNLAFLHQYLSLMSIMIPRWNSKESGLLVSQGVFLALRTWLSLVVARLDGEIVRDLVAGQGKAFLWGLVKWCGIGGKVYPISSHLN
jgi:ATP-binding cassette, subfamily D (ALD), peroxisomal long-chain fatty acid import protein